MSDDHTPRFDTIKALSVRTVTLVGVHYDKYPFPSGNCFDVKAEDGKVYNILNFNNENLKHLLKTTRLKWPIEIHPLSERHAVIHDPRIPADYYSAKFCEACSPYDLLPLPQKLALARRVLTGQDKYSKCEEEGLIKGMVFVTKDLRKENQSLWDSDPDCEHDIVEKPSGIECSKCGGWFCY